MNTDFLAFFGCSMWRIYIRCSAGILFWSIISYSLHSFYYPPTLCYLLSAKVISDKYSKYWHYILVKLVLLQYFKSWFEFGFFIFLSPLLAGLSNFIPMFTVRGMYIYKFAFSNSIFVLSQDAVEAFSSFLSSSNKACCSQWLEGA